MVQTLADLMRQNTGFSVDHVLTFDLPQPSLPMVKNEDALVDGQIEQLREISEVVRRLPGVAEVAAADHGVLDGIRYVHSGLELEDAPTDKALLEQDVFERYVTPKYFPNLCVPLVRGAGLDR